MAVDTEAKRVSAILPMFPSRGVLPPPDGSVSQADRQHLALLYGGVLAEEYAASFSGDDSTSLNLSRLMRIGL